MTILIKTAQRQNPFTTEDIADLHITNINFDFYQQWPTDILIYDFFQIYLEDAGQDLLMNSQYISATESTISFLTMPGNQSHNAAGNGINMR